MFDTEHPGLVDLPVSDDEAVAGAIAGWARIEAAAAARRLAAVAELVRRRTNVDQDRAHWACDEWDAAAAEVAAALGVSHGKASSQMYLALALRERLPQVAALFADGRLSAQQVAVICWHTTLITDPDALAQVDAEVAAEARHYGTLSTNKTAAAIDAIIDREGIHCNHPDPDRVEPAPTPPAATASAGRWCVDRPRRPRGPWPSAAAVLGRRSCGAVRLAVVVAGTTPVMLVAGSPAPGPTLAGQPTTRNAAFAAAPLPG